jgi:G3E family GTPase
VQTFLLDGSVAVSYRPDAILTMVDAAQAMRQLDERHEARRQVGFADHIFISKADLVGATDLRALEMRLQQMNPRARRRQVHFGDVALSNVFDLRGFTPTPELELEAAEPGLCHDGPHDHAGHHHHADDVQSFVFRAAAPLHPGRLGQVLGALTEGFGPKLLRYKGVLHMAGTDRKVVFQGVHQMISSDLGPVWAAGEARYSRIVFIGIELPQAMILRSLERCVLRGPA